MKKTLLNLVALTALSGLPFGGYAQAPPLGTAAGYVLFSSTGAVGNTGALSHFTGNVGTVTGAITMGVNVNGVIHNADPATSAAADDVLSAYNQLDTTTPTSVRLPGSGSADTVGAGDTLYAGVAAFSRNTVVNDTLILDGQGSADAVFIFKINGTLSSAPNARVILINGALACNVFWQVDGTVSLAANTTMRGTIIANSSAINLASGVTLEGRALTATSGAVTATNALAYVPTGCGSPVLTGPIAPPLGTVACYAMFTGNGENTNAGSSIVTGDVGTNMGLTTGYDSLLVNGTIHPVPDTSTSAAAADLLLVHTYLNAMTPDITLQFPAQFGNNLVLTPHTYRLNAATAIIDTVYLNAEGNPNAVFVIQVNGALTTSTFSSVVLTNGAQAKNVYWHVDGAASIADSSVFKGTIVSGGAVSLGTGVNIEGRALTITGAFTAAAVTVTAPDSNCASAVSLPVSWLYFRGTPAGESVLLEWATAHELNNGAYTLEKSLDAKTFEPLAYIAASAETGKASYTYSFTDNQPCRSCYYRISQTDVSGQRAYFRTIQVISGHGAASNTAAYVGADAIQLQYAGPVLGEALLSLYSTEGRRVSSQKIILTSERSTYELAKPWGKGMYLICLESAGRKLYTGKVIVN